MTRRRDDPPAPPSDARRAPEALRPPPPPLPALVDASVNAADRIMGGLARDVGAATRRLGPGAMTQAKRARLLADVDAALSQVYGASRATAAGGALGRSVQTSALDAELAALSPILTRLSRALDADPRLRDRRAALRREAG
jgi:alkylhydroperoxidase family enzyme